MKVILIDSSAFMYSCLFSYLKISEYGHEAIRLSEQYEMDDFVSYSLASVNEMLTEVMNSGVGAIVWAKDGNSWRFRLKDNPVAQVYKATRKKQDDIDWHNYTICKSKIDEVLEQNGIIVSTHKSLEADDIITIWVKELSKNSDVDIEIFSSDKDLTQLLTPNVKMIDRIRGKMYIHESLFDQMNTDPTLMALGASYAISPVNPYEVVVGKIISGDSSDNIPSIVRTTTKTGKVMGIGDAGSKKIIAKIKEDYNLKNLNIDTMSSLKSIICEECIKYKKINPDEDPAIVELTDKMYDFNNEMINLNKIPEEYINEILEESITKQIDDFTSGSFINIGNAIHVLGKYVKKMNIDYQGKVSASAAVSAFKEASVDDFSMFFES